MARINLSGMGVALITPFKEDESIDFEALSRLIEYLIQNGTDYLVVLGTTAETPTLTEEQKDIIEYLMEFTAYEEVEVKGRYYFFKTFSFVIMFIFHHFDGIQNGAAMEFSYFQAFLFGLEHFINIRK